MTVIDDISIKSMKHSDFNLLEAIIEQYKRDGTYYGRKDYHDASLERLQAWVFAVNVVIKDCRIGKFKDNK